MSNYISNEKCHKPSTEMKKKQENFCYYDQQMKHKTV